MSSVTLNGSGSHDPNGDPLTYLWTQTGGTPVTLSNPTAVNPSFKAPEAHDLDFSLVVTDNHSSSCTRSGSYYDYQGSNTFMPIILSNAEVSFLGYIK